MVGDFGPDDLRAATEFLAGQDQGLVSGHRRPQQFDQFIRIKRRPVEARFSIKQRGLVGEFGAVLIALNDLVKLFR